MKRLYGVILAAALAFWAPSSSVSAAEPAVGKPLPDFVLAAPKDSAARGYLGIAGGSSFRIADIKAQAVVIEIFSMYCPYCQKDAPLVNELYRKIEGGPHKGKIKIVGIGVGNSAFEVETFRKKYAIPFPLFPDGDFALHRLLGELRTPYFIVVRLSPGAVPQVVYAKLGGFEQVDPFLGLVVKSAEVR